ncbi:DnaB-like helicase C-terminal domain-containing protein [Streptomyces sp. NPDC087659]|uniref:DnaB-like helicase C-terminal domain-containing protein n=1 Tax=Streptomyces sp. NPDC087659 TaxID=3365801 RepID=UPI0037FD138C
MAEANDLPHAEALCEEVFDDLTDNMSHHTINRASRPTGFSDFDKLTGGLAPGTLTVIASRPGIGRTTLLTDICRANAVKDLHGTNEKHLAPTAVFTLEESRTDMACRILSAEARVVLHRLRAGTLNDDEWNRVNKRLPAVQAAPLYIHAPGRLTLAELAHKASVAVQECGVRLIALDGIQDVKPNQRNDLREREVGDTVRELKTLARELDVPILATSHLNRGPEQRPDRWPMLDDLRESGAVTFAADIIVLIHRPDAYDWESPRAGEADLIVAKHRQGPTARVTVAAQLHYSRFVDMAQT